MGPGRTPTVHRYPKGKAVGGPQQTSDERPSDNDMPRTNVLSGKQEQTDVLSTKTGVDRHLYTYTVVEHARRSHGDRAVKQLTRSRLVNRFEVEASQIIKKDRAEKWNHRSGEDQSGLLERNRVHQSPQNQYTDKLLMCLLQCSERSLRIKRHTERVRQRDSTSEFGLDLRYSERAY